MRRLLVLAVLVAAVGAAVAVEDPRPAADSNPRYTVELDNAFGITQGADLKVAGVRAGRITGLRVDPESHRALIDFEVTEDGFGSLRTDVFCESRPQSLIGEYFVDCKPGQAKETLPDGATIPVEQTASTIPIDLVNNILRRPYRERLGIILDELGVGVAGRADDIDETIRRASPALRETDRVLANLADQNAVLRDLVTNADTVIGDLAGNRRDVGRWVTETRQVAAASAERRGDIAAGLQRLPTFLRELKPTMAALGATADAQVPSLRNLNASAGQLTTLLENLEPYAEASQVNFDSLAHAARKGRPAVRAALPTVAELDRATEDAPELGNNAAIVLDHLDDRKFAVEKDQRSPGGQGYTGLEAFLSYFFDQAMAINTFDQNGYILKVNLFVSKCSDYQNLQSLKEKMKEDPSFFADCAAVLGPNLPGITQPDPSFTGAQVKDEPKAPHGKQRERSEPRPPEPPERAPELPKAPEPPRAGGGNGDVKDELTKAERRARRRAERMKERLEDTLGIELPELPPGPVPPQLPQPPAVPGTPPIPGVPAPAPGGVAPAQTDELLDFLLGP